MRQRSKNTAKKRTEDKERSKMICHAEVPGARLGLICVSIARGDGLVL